MTALVGACVSQQHHSHGTFQMLLSVTALLWICTFEQHRSHGTLKRTVFGNGFVWGLYL